MVPKGLDALGAAIYTRLIAPHPIELVVVRAGNDMRFAVEDDRLRMTTLEFAPGFMLAHELGHLAEATDEQFFMPDLGMTPASKTGEGIQGGRVEVLRETRVFAFQLWILRELEPGGKWDYKVLDRACSVIGGLLPSEGTQKGGHTEFRRLVEANVADTENYGFEAFERAWAHKMELLGAPVRV